MEAPKPSPTRAAAAHAAAAKVTARLASSSASDSCVVCLHACTTKACACSYMHEQCAASYIKWNGTDSCRVCNGAIEVSKLCKRPRELEQESEEDQRARKRMKEKKVAAAAANLEWAQTVAPSAALIILRHFTHSRGGASAQQEAQGMGFDAVVLSLCHSGPEYLDDLREDLSHTVRNPPEPPPTLPPRRVTITRPTAPAVVFTLSHPCPVACAQWPPAEVESRMRKLHDISDNLSTDAVRAAPAPPRACSHPLCLLTPCALLTLVPAHPTGVGSVGAGRRGMQ